jgi:hypothetical protein
MVLLYLLFLVPGRLLVELLPSVLVVGFSAEREVIL